jgi:hypothetical protein
MNHIENLTTEENNSILKYYNSIRCDQNRANEYLKRHTFVVSIKRRRISKSENKIIRSNNFEYFVEINNERKNVCKNAFLELHQITRGRLVSKIQHNREQTQ